MNWCNRETGSPDDAFWMSKRLVQEALRLAGENETLPRHGWVFTTGCALEFNGGAATVRCMEVARVLPMSAADYLAFEESSAVKHEFVGGEIHAMSGVSLAHNKITLNIYSALRAGLLGGPCQVFVADVKVRLEAARDEFFYYPDVVVTCHPTGRDTHFLRFPTLVFEVLSPATEAIDRREKNTHYRLAQTLEEYVLVAQERREVTIFRRPLGWQGEIFTAPEAHVEFQSVQQTMTVAAIYEGVFA